MALKEFYLDESLAWDITTYQEWNSYLVNDATVTDDALVELIKGKGKCSITGSDDGPEFKALRNQLEADGFIECQRSWWNGDRVLKPFVLNGHKFKKYEQFSCGAALKLHIDFARSYKKKK